MLKRITRSIFFSLSLSISLPLFLPPSLPPFSMHPNDCCPIVSPLPLALPPVFHSLPSAAAAAPPPPPSERSWPSSPPSSLFQTSDSAPSFPGSHWKRDGWRRGRRRRRRRTVPREGRSRRLRGCSAESVGGGLRLRLTLAAAGCGRKRGGSGGRNLTVQRRRGGKDCRGWAPD